MIVARREMLTGRLLLVLLVGITLLPFLSLLSAALAPSDSTPLGIEWPSDPQWGNFVDAFNIAQMPALILSSVLIVLGVVPAAVVISTMAGFAIGHLRIIGGRWLFLVFLIGLTLPFEGIITPLYYLAQGLGILNTKWAIILPLIGLYMPFAVFWMRAHFINMPSELSEAARVDGATTWDLFWHIHLPLGEARPVSPRHPPVRLDLEPVPARLGARRGSTPADHGRRPWCLSGPLRDEHPAPVRRVPADPHPDVDRLPALPAAVHLGPAAGFAERLNEPMTHASAMFERYPVTAAVRSCPVADSPCLRR